MAITLTRVFFLQKLRVALFIGLVGAVYLATAVFLARSVFRRIRGGPPPAREPRFLRSAVFSLALLGVLCFLWGLLVEPNWLETSRVRIESQKLAGASRPIKIVLFSDTHCRERPRLEERIIEAIEVEKPDLVFFAGDAANPGGVGTFRGFLERVGGLAPTYVVRGNWDNSVRFDVFRGIDVQQLDGAPIETEVAGAKLWITGLADRNRSRAEEVLSRTPPDRFSVFLIHRPDAIETAAKAGIDLYLAGHTHGGQVALPFYGALITFSSFGKRFESGLYHVGGTTLYVTRGVGMDGAAPPVRFCARPELTVIELSSGAPQVR